LLLFVSAYTEGERECLKIKMLNGKQNGTISIWNGYAALRMHKAESYISAAALLHQDEIHGSLLEQIDKVMELVYLKYMKAKIRYDGIRRVERYFVPDDTLREAILNAICHKQYQSGIPIQISVYEDMLYVANIGRLPENWTLDDLMRKHASVPFNPRIAYVFYLAGFIESWGRGIEKICSVCKAEGLPKPEYAINPDDIMGTSKNCSF